MPPAKRTIPSFDAWLAGVPERARAVVKALDALALGERGVAREIHWDGLARDFTPSYKIANRELYHVHPTEGGAGITFSVSVRELEPRIEADAAIAGELKRKIHASKDYRGTRWVFTDCASVADVAGLAPLIANKSRWLRARAEDKTK